MVPLGFPISKSVFEQFHFPKWRNSAGLTQFRWLFFLKVWSADLKMKQNNIFKYVIWITGIWEPFWRILARKWIGFSANQPEAVCSENTVERLGRKWGIFFIWAFFLSRWRTKIQVSQHKQLQGCSSTTLLSNCINAICMLHLCYT